MAWCKYHAALAFGSNTCAILSTLCSKNNLNDAKEVFVYKLDEIPFDKLVFDHEQIILDFLRNKMYGTVN